MELITSTECLIDFGGDLVPLVEILINARLLSTEGEGEDSTVSVAHEKLFEVWPTLTHWIAENQDDLRLLRQVRRAAGDAHGAGVAVAHGGWTARTMMGRRGPMGVRRAARAGRAAFRASG